MTQSSSTFASVKLPSTLVAQAREAAQPMRRSVAGQVEYWAMLGQIVEHSGLTVQEAQTAISNYEATARRARPSLAVPTSQADALLSQFMAGEANANLAQSIAVVATRFCALMMSSCTNYRLLLQARVCKTKLQKSCCCWTNP